MFKYVLLVVALVASVCAKPLVVEYPVAAAYTATAPLAAYSSPYYGAYAAYSAPLAYSAYSYASPYAYYVR